MALRRWGATWHYQALFALLCEFQTNHDALPVYEAFLQHLQRLGLEGTKALDEKPILDGRQIKDILARQKGGPANRYAADLAMEWQFDHPGEDAAACAEMIRTRRSEILRTEELQIAASKKTRKRGSDEL